MKKNKNFLIVLITLFSIQTLLFFANQIKKPTETSILGSVETNWKLVWSDEFDGTTVNTNKWGVHDWISGYDIGGYLGFGDAAYHSTMVSQSNGLLNIRTEKTPYSNKQYQTGGVATWNKYTFKYGLVKIRAQLPQMTQGFWPGLWFIAEDSGRNARYEVDLMEAVNLPNKIYFNYHDNVHDTNPNSSYSGPDFSAAMHDYEMEWLPDRLIIRIDGIEYLNVTSNVPDMPMYLIINTALGGSWPGTPDSTTILPATMKIDYVRIYQPSTPNPVATPTPTVIPTPIPTVIPTPTSLPISVATPTPQITRLTNLLSNPSFETSLKGWSQWHSSINRTTLAYSGRYAAKVGYVIQKITTDHPDVYSIDNWPGIRGIKTGETYTASTWIRGSFLNLNKDAAITIREHDSSGNISNQTQSPSIKLTNRWQKITVTHTVKLSTSSYLDLYVSQSGASKNNYFLVDNLSLTKQ